MSRTGLRAKPHGRLLETCLPGNFASLLECVHACALMHVCTHDFTYRNAARVIGAQSTKKNISKHLETFSKCLPHLWKEKKKTDLVEQRFSHICWDVSRVTVSRESRKPGPVFPQGKVSLVAFHLVPRSRVCTWAPRPHAWRSRPPLRPRPPTAAGVSLVSAPPLLLRGFIPSTLLCSCLFFFAVRLYQYLVSKYLVPKLLFWSCLARTLHPNASIVNSFIHHLGSRPCCEETHPGSL